MSLLTALTRKRQSANVPVPYVRTNSAMGAFGSTVGSSSTAQLDKMTTSGTLFAIVNRLATATATPAWTLYRTPTKRRPDDDDNREVIEASAHAAAALLHRPNPFMAWSDLMEAGQQHVELVGECFLVVTKVAGIPIEIWPVRPDRMVEVPHPTKFLERWDYRSPDGELIALPADEVIHVKTPNPTNFFRGLSPVAALLAELNGSQAAAEWTANFFHNSAQPGGIIKVDRRLSDDEFETLRMRWDEQHRGVSNAHRVAIIEAGDWVNRSFSMRDMEFTALRNLARDQIMEAYGISRASLGVTDGINYAAAKAADLQFAKLLQIPRLNRWKQAVNAKLLPMFGTAGEGVEFDYKSPAEGDPMEENAERNSKVTAVCELIQAGFNPSSAAEAYGLPKMQYGIGEYDPDRDLLTKVLITSGGTLAHMILPMLGFELPPEQGPAVENADRNSRAEAVAQLIEAGFNPTSAAKAYELPEMQYGLSGYDPDRDLLVKTLISSGGTLGQLILPMLGFELPTPEEQGKEEEPAIGPGGEEVAPEEGDPEQGDDDDETAPPDEDAEEADEDEQDEDTPPPDDSDVPRETPEDR
jgi:HK97 family phage portal protein